MSVGWIVVSFFTMFIALSMAEIVSAIPTAGGPYYWAAMLAPQKHSAFASWITGWCVFLPFLCCHLCSRNLIGILGDAPLALRGPLPWGLFSLEINISERTASAAAAPGGPAERLLLEFYVQSNGIQANTSKQVQPPRPSSSNNGHLLRPRKPHQHHGNRPQRLLRPHPRKDNRHLRRCPHLPRHDQYLRHPHPPLSQQQLYHPALVRRDRVGDCGLGESADAPECQICVCDV